MEEKGRVNNINIKQKEVKSTKKLRDRSFVKQGVTKDWLLSHGFRYSPIYSYDKEEVYVLTFPLYTSTNKSFDEPIIQGEIVINYPSGEIKLNMYHGRSRNCYVPFYHSEWGKNSLIKKLNERFLKKLKQLKIKEIKEVNED